MKMYLFMTNGITGMGGGQMYVNNKAQFMRNKGWETCVISSLPGEVMIPGLKSYENWIDETLISPFAYRKKQREQKLEQIIKSLELHKYEEIFIESGIAHMTYWAELLAGKIGARHLAYPLDERNDLLVPEEYLPFFAFKYNRRELAGITDSSIPMLFRNRIDLEAGKKCQLGAVCQNVVEDCDHSVLHEIRPESMVLCCIGRLEKPFVKTAVRAFLQIVKDHSDQQFDVVMIGGTTGNSIITSIENEFANLKNVKLIMAGHVFPIPRALFDKVAVVISSAGSAGVAYREGVPTISIDGKDAMAIGVMGYTTQKALYRCDEPLQDAAELAEKILFGNYLRGLPFTPNPRQPDLSALETHISFMNNMDKSKEYFPIDTLQKCRKDKIKFFICSAIGVQNYMRIRNVLKQHK